MPEAAPYAATRRVGDVTLQALWPLPGAHATGPGDGSTANDASVVLLVEVAGVRLLLTGDVEPEAQAALARAWPGLHVDVLKVPHHGQPLPGPRLPGGLGARLALVSAGEDNDYGHPAPETLAALAGTGAEVLRTDLDGDLAVVVRGRRGRWRHPCESGPAVAGRRGPSASAVRRRVPRKATGAERTGVTATGTTQLRAGSEHQLRCPGAGLRRPLSADVGAPWPAPLPQTSSAGSPW